ncbi:MAG: flagellin FliC, partial [SAR324 cluster bacterium]|nr:flagellin FliC [SAR324 cluster bacterium]
MAITIGMNIASLNVLGKLQDASSSFAKSAERLSSGLRINSASDDAAGLALSSSLKASTRIYTQALRNVNDATSLFNVAEGAIRELSTIVSRQLELANQAASGSYSSAQLEALNEEANALVNEYNRIIDTTKFNGMTLLNGTFQNFQVQVGDGGTINDFITFSIGQMLMNYGSGSTSIVNDGTFNARTYFLTTETVRSMLA